jgi:hypothetical protein
MRFGPGNKYSRGGTKGNKGGRPTKIKAEVKKMAQEMIRPYILSRIKPVLDMYLALGTGKVIKRGKREYELQVDPATVRDIIDKFVPPAEDTKGKVVAPIIYSTNLPPERPAAVPVREEPPPTIKEEQPIDEVDPERLN